MTTANMRLRLEKNEASVKPRRPVMILFEPSSDAGNNPVAWEAHARDVSEAKALGGQVGVVVFVKPAKAREPIEGVRYFDHYCEVVLADLDPATFLDTLTGNAFGVAPGASSPSVSTRSLPVEGSKHEY
ncbi:MAG: hypothetical protein WBJ68_12220 [Candidatus Dechloromonas phosphoritropha]|mgnify:CR=1 FL=1|jgi:hypothetical protein|nr:hypothetical protein [Candidatus Dechloromonas phosphoritropha]